MPWHVFQHQLQLILKDTVGCEPSTTVTRRKHMVTRAGRTAVSQEPSKKVVERILTKHVSGVATSQVVQLQ